MIVAHWGVVPAISWQRLSPSVCQPHDALLKLNPAIRLGHRSTPSVVHDAIEGIRYVPRHPGMGPLFLYAATVGC